MSSVLIVDDEPGIRTVLSDIFEDESYSVFAAADGIEGLEILEREDIDLVILDVLLPRMGGIDVLKEIKRSHRTLEVIVISGHANIDIAVRAVKLGAFDFVEKPLSMEKIMNSARNALRVERLEKENAALKANLPDDTMIGGSEPMQTIWERIQQASATNAKVLIHGENGTGKELIAREIHRRSNRGTRPFVEVNCAAIPDTLIESELFGHEKGAFTHAINRRKGKFEMADTGTIFLDEIADMSLAAQAKVLRVIQEMQFERVGGEASLSVDVRVIAATNKDIQIEIKRKTFREDLFFRLNVVPIEVPSLRDRTEDIEELVDYFLNKFAANHGIEGKRFDKSAMTRLTEYRWPGNVRELKNFVERISIMSDDAVIGVNGVDQFLGDHAEGLSESDSSLDEFQDMKLTEARNEFEKKLIEVRLRENEYNISKTAEVLGIYPSNLHGKIKKLGIRREK